MSRMTQTRGLIIGIAVASILVVGFVFWLGEDGIGLRSQAENDAPSSTAFGTSGEWGVMSPEFGAEEGLEEHAGGSDRWGHFTVEELCLQEEVDLEVAKTRLAAYELAFDADQQIRDLADASGYKPSGITDILLGSDPGAGCDDPDCDHDSGSSSGSENHECDDKSCDEEQAVDDSKTG